MLFYIPQVYVKHAQFSEDNKRRECESFFIIYGKCWVGSAQLHFLNSQWDPHFNTSHHCSLLDGVNRTLTKSLVSLSNRIMYLEVYNPHQDSSYHLLSGPCVSVGVCYGAACVYKQLNLTKSQDPTYRTDLPFNLWTDEGRVLSMCSEIIWGNLLC